MIFFEILLAVNVNLYNQGNEYYRKGDFENAVKSYKSLVDEGIKNPYLFYNLGNAYYRLGKRGMALLYYKRAYYLLPSDTDIRNNIAFISGVSNNSNPVVRFLNSIVNYFSLRLSLYLTLLFFGISMVVLTIFILQRRISQIVFLSVFIFLFLVFSSISGLWMKRINSKEVVFIEDATGMSGPGKNYSRLIEIQEAATGHILRESDGYYLVSLGGGRGGWIDTTKVRRVW